MSVTTMTGLEIMQAMADGSLPHPPITETIPMKVKSVEKGTVIFEAHADERHLNPFGGVHGGFAASVLDAVTGCAVHTMLEPGVGYGTVDLNVKMLKAVPMQKKLIAEGRVISVSKSIGASEGALKDSEGKIYAHATATCMIFRQIADNKANRLCIK